MISVLSHFTKSSSILGGLLKQILFLWFTMTVNPNSAWSRVLYPCLAKFISPFSHLFNKRLLLTIQCARNPVRSPLTHAYLELHTQLSSFSIFITLPPQLEGLPGWLNSKHRRCGFDPRVGKIPWRRVWQPTPVFLTREFPWTEEPGGLESMGSPKTPLSTERTHTHPN